MHYKMTAAQPGRLSRANSGLGTCGGKRSFVHSGPKCAMFRATGRNCAVDDIRKPSRITDAELAEIRRRRPGVRASLACEGMVLTAEDEALFEQMDRERLTADEGAQRILEISRTKRRAKALVSG
jgi:hypothetical protein